MQTSHYINTTPTTPRLAQLIKQLHKLEPLGDQLPAFPKQLMVRNIRLIDATREQPQPATTAARHSVQDDRDAAAARPQPVPQRPGFWVSQLKGVVIIPKQTVVSAAVQAIEGAMPRKTNMKQAERDGASSLLRRVTQEIPAAQASAQAMEKIAPPARARPLSPVAQFAYRNMFAPQAPLRETGIANEIAANAAASPHISTIPVPGPVPDEHGVAAESRSTTRPTTPPSALGSSPRATHSDSDAASRHVKGQPSTTAGPNRPSKTTATKPSATVVNTQSPREAMLAELLAKTASKRASEHLPVGTEATTTPEAGRTGSQKHSASDILAIRYPSLASPALVKQSHEHPARPPVIVASHHKPHALRMGATQSALIAELARRAKVAAQAMDDRHVPDASIRSLAKETPPAVATDQAERARAAAEMKKTSLNLIKELTAKHLAPECDADREDRMARYEGLRSPPHETFHDSMQIARETATRLAAEVASDMKSGPATVIVNTGTLQPKKSALRTSAGNPATRVAGKHRLQFSEDLVKVKTFESDSEMDSDYSSGHEVEEAASSERRTSSVDGAWDPVAPQPVHFVGRPIT